MRISPFHMEIAKRVALGQPNREIMKEIQICGSRLSVLKANPVFQRQVEKYQKIEADKYQKAVGVFSKNAEAVAQEIVNIATSVIAPHKTKLDAGVEILNRVAQSEGIQAGGQDGEEVVFEQMLRVTKKSMGLDRSTDSSDSDATDMGKAEKELEEDLQVPAFVVDQLKSANVQTG